MRVAIRQAALPLDRQIEILDPVPVSYTHLAEPGAYLIELPVAHWHEALGHPTLADAILDRLVHHAHPLALTGESLRKHQPTLTEESTRE